jgi:hypothetical protein
MLKNKLLIPGIFIFIILGCFFVYLFSLFSDFLEDPGFYGRKVLLQQTDFPELLIAGRELISKAEWNEYAAEYDAQKRRDLFIPEDVNIPEPINTLRQKLSALGGIISIHNTGCLKISFRGSRETGDFGLFIFPEDYNEPKRQSINHDNIMLLPGLWYYDGAYYQFPKLRDENQKLIKKNKFLKNN